MSFLVNDKHFLNRQCMNKSEQVSDREKNSPDCDDVDSSAPIKYDFKIENDDIFHK